MYFTKMFYQFLPKRFLKLWLSSIVTRTAGLSARPIIFSSFVWQLSQVSRIVSINSPGASAPGSNCIIKSFSWPVPNSNMDGQIVNGPIEVDPGSTAVLKFAVGHSEGSAVVNKSAIHFEIDFKIDLK